MNQPFFLLCAFCALSCTALASPAVENAAVIKTVSGTVSVIRHNAPLENVGGGTPLFAADAVRTGKTGSVGIGFRDGTRISLGPDSAFTVSDYRFRPAEKSFSFRLYMQKGSMVYASGKLGKLDPEAVRIATPQGTVGIRGTKLLIKVE